eukprot:15466829-Alexandrium_andersonii.AAC.1
MGALLVGDGVLTQEGLQEAAAEAEEKGAVGSNEAVEAEPFAYDAELHPPPEGEDVSMAEPVLPPEAVAEHFSVATPAGEGG